jgi:O-antigen ligase
LSIHSLDGLYQYLTGFDLLKHKAPDAPTYLLTGAVYQHNPFGVFMSIGASLSLVLFFDKINYTIWKYEKTLYFALLILFLFTLFHSQSRAAWLMFSFFTFGYLGLYLKNNGIDKKLFFTILSITLFATLLFLFDTNLSHRLSLLIEGNSAGRTSVIWPFTIEKIKESPLLGYGINTYKLFKEHCCNGVHNLSLELLLYTGIVGFLIMYSLIILTLKEGFKNAKALYPLLLLSYILLLQFDGSLITSKVHINIFIVMLFFIYTSKIVKQNNIQNS